MKYNGVQLIAEKEKKKKNQEIQKKNHTLHLLSQEGFQVIYIISEDVILSIAHHCEKIMLGHWFKMFKMLTNQVQAVILNEILLGSI